MSGHEWSDKILQGLHRASEMLADRESLLDTCRENLTLIRAERDSLRNEHDRVWDQLREAEAARDMARAEAKQANEAYQDKERAWPQAVQLAAERQMVEWVGRVKWHESCWSQAMAILGMSGELQGPDEVLRALSRAVEERDAARAEASENNKLLKCSLVELDEARTQCDQARREAKGWQERAHECELRMAPEPKIAVGTGPVADPETTPEPPTMPRNLDECLLAIKGLHDVVAKHSREIGTLQDECRTLRERVADVEQRYETAICEDCGYRYRKPADSCPSCGRAL